MKFNPWRANTSPDGAGSRQIAAAAAKAGSGLAAEQAALIVDYGDGDEVIVRHQDGDVRDIGVRADPDRIGVGHVDHDGVRIGLDQGDQPGHAAQAALVADGVHAGQRLGLKRDGLADPGQRVSNRCWPRSAYC